MTYVLRRSVQVCDLYSKYANRLTKIPKIGTFTLRPDNRIANRDG